MVDRVCYFRTILNSDWKNLTHHSKWRGFYIPSILVRKPEGTRPFGRSNCIQKNTIKIDIEEIGV